MNHILKTASLDFALLKPYMKAICFVLLAPAAYTLLSRSLTSGVAFAMCVMSMSSSYTFAVSEKNGMERLYGILPVSKKHLVLGKYLCVCCMGLLAIFVSLVLQPLVLRSLSIPVSSAEILRTGLMGAVMFILYIAFQIPGYYKYGSIKGRVFMYIPVAGFVLISFFFGSTNSPLIPALITLLSSPFMTVALALLLMIVMLTASISISLNILQKKEY